MTNSRSWPASKRLLRSGGILAAAVTTACTALLGGAEGVLRQADEAGFRHPAAVSSLFVLLRQQSPSSFLTVYIEGDGAPWQGGRPPRDPTPHDPLALRLALRDGSAAVAYLGRPCQYLPADERRDCSPDLWAGARYGEEALARTHRAIDQLRQRSGARQLRLVGYSGGGTLAALLAAQRDDVSCLVTLAAPLDLAAWVAHHRVSPLTASLDPVARAARLRGLPQRHFVGAADSVVPVATFARFGQLAAVKPVVLPGQDHACCWAEAWPELLRSSCLAD